MANRCFTSFRPTMHTPAVIAATSMAWCCLP